MHLPRMSRSVLFAACLALGCQAKQTPVPYRLSIRVAGDPGKPLADAVISRGATEIARTNSGGVASFELQGTEGDTIGIDVACPQGFKSPAAPVQCLVPS